MEREELRTKIVEFLFSLQNIQKITLDLIDLMSRSFNIDVLNICEEEGITYYEN
jgi:hypothetical protein